MWKQFRSLSSVNRTLFHFYFDLYWFPKTFFLLSSWVFTISYRDNKKRCTFLVHIANWFSDLATKTTTFSFRFYNKIKFQLNLHFYFPICNNVKTNRSVTELCDTFFFLLRFLFALCDIESKHKLFHCWWNAWFHGNLGPWNVRQISIWIDKCP